MAADNSQTVEEGTTVTITQVRGDVVNTFLVGSAQVFPGVVEDARYTVESVRGEGIGRKILLAPTDGDSDRKPFVAVCNDPATTEAKAGCQFEVTGDKDHAGEKHVNFQTV